MELPFAGLHQLCMPLLAGLDSLAEPQRGALCVAFGLASGATPDRLLVGLATLSLMAAAAESQPLLCVVDDLQWLDAASVQVLGFVARRMLAEPMAIVFAVREPSDGRQLAGLTELRLERARLRRRARPADERRRRADGRHASGSASSRRRGAIRSRCWSCRGA